MKFYKLIPYYVAHSIVAFLIAIPFYFFEAFNWGLIAGIFFYIGREVAQYEYEKKFDWEGLIFPLITNTLILIFYNR